uniref:Uncharacterized protein n=1 Tax=Mycena chlorophos TaxID=658473 RepID=A0ABQ0L9Y3_MYCCL|nr:predicted protein [Mycena chlorophos]
MDDCDCDIECSDFQCGDCLDCDCGHCCDPHHNPCFNLGLLLCRWWAWSDDHCCTPFCWDIWCSRRKLDGVPPPGQRRPPGDVEQQQPRLIADMQAPPTYAETEEAALMGSRGSPLPQEGDPLLGKSPMGTTSSAQHRNEAGSQAALAEALLALVGLQKSILCALLEARRGRQDYHHVTWMHGFTRTSTSMKSSPTVQRLGGWRSWFAVAPAPTTGFSSYPSIDLRDPDHVPRRFQARPSSTLIPSIAAKKVLTIKETKDGKLM